MKRKGSGLREEGWRAPNKGSRAEVLERAGRASWMRGGESVRTDGQPSRGVS